MPSPNGAEAPPHGLRRHRGHRRRGFQRLGFQSRGVDFFEIKDHRNRGVVLLSAEREMVFDVEARAPEGRGVFFCLAPEGRGAIKDRGAFFFCFL